MFEEHKLLLPKHCGHCNKSLGFHGKHIKCNQCLHIYHTTCVEKVSVASQPPCFGTAVGPKTARRTDTPCVPPGAPQLPAGALWQPGGETAKGPAPWRQPRYVP